MSEQEKVKLNQESIQICPVCEKKSVVVWYSSGYEHTKMFCLECGRFWIESEGINEDPREYIDWKIRELDKKVQEMVEDVKSKLINNSHVIQFPDSGARWSFGEEEEDTYGKIIDEKNKHLDEEVEDLVEDLIKTVNTACVLSGIPCDPSAADGINYIERCLKRIKKKGEKR